jgi:hypothetical protein
MQSGAYVLLLIGGGQERTPESERVSAGKTFCLVLSTHIYVEFISVNLSGGLTSNPLDLGPARQSFHHQDTPVLVVAAARFRISFSEIHYAQVNAMRP